MSYMQGTSREQVAIVSLEDMVSEENIVRVIDRFVDICNIQHLGFTGVEAAATGRPAYPAEMMIKLYIYGYENGVRSSRKLEKECYRNVEMMWLANGLKPDHKTISDFRKNNIRPLQKLLREFVKLCKSWDLIGGSLIAIDGTKIKASNNKKTNFSKKKLTDRINRLDEKINNYLVTMDIADQKDSEPSNQHLTELQNLLARKENYQGWLTELEATGENEKSLVDPDARLMGNNRGGVEMAYNVQSAVDSKHHLILDYSVGMNPSDQHQLSKMVKQVKSKLKLKRFIAVADKGYYNGEDLTKVKKQKITAIVSRQKPTNPKNQPAKFHSDKFTYHKETNTYSCPLGNIMRTGNNKTANRMNYSNKAACKECPYLDQCALGKCGYRSITRNQYAAIYEEVDNNTKANMDIYRKRQQLVEHPFGTIKFTMNGYYFLLRTRKKVRSEIALLFLGYNLKRVYKVLGFKEIMARLNSLATGFSFYFVKLQEIMAYYSRIQAFELSIGWF